MDDEPKKKRKTYDEKACVTAVAVSAVAGIVAGLFYETGQTFGKWIEAEIIAFFVSFFVVGIIIAIPLGGMNRYRNKNGEFGIFALIVACIVTNLVFLYASWSIRKIEIGNENARQEEYYQSGYEDGARDARAELEGYCSQEELEWYGDSRYSEGYEVGYGKGYNDGVDSLPDIWDRAYDEGYLSGYECGVFDAQ